jgi:endonuclease IV
MKTINETYEIALKDKKVEVIHTGFKALKDQENALNEVQECIQDSILNNKKTDGFIPYNNFECSITWRVI